MWKEALFLPAAMLLAGCEADFRQTGPMQHLAQSVELGNYENARLEVNMGAGSVTLGGGAQKLLDADFNYNVAAWKPVFAVHNSSLRADIDIKQPGRVSGMGNAHNEWDLHLNDQVPWDIVTHLGAGEARMDLGSTALRKLVVHMGVGELALNLLGTPKHSFEVEIHGGVGEARVRLPKSANIVATAQGGIGDISVDGLERHGGRWINPAAENAPVTIRLEAHGGVGSIRISAE
jgi:N-terminal domain of toast_rack, DUF2154